MRDLIFGYVFIFAALFAFIGSIYSRRSRLERRRQDLQEELRESTSKGRGRT